MSQAAGDGDFVNAFFHGVADEVHPDGGLAGLTNAVDSCDGL